MEVLGKIKSTGTTQIFGSNGFAKRELILTTEEQYPQVLAIEFVKEKTNLLDAFAAGQSVKVGVNLRGREWVNPQGETKYFNSIQGWKIEAMAGSAAGTPPAPVHNAVPTTQFEPATDLNEEDYDDLPF
jgi:hypothetical protein